MYLSEWRPFPDLLTDRYNVQQDEKTANIPEKQELTVTPVGSGGRCCCENQMGELLRVISKTASVAALQKFGPYMLERQRPLQQHPPTFQQWGKVVGNEPCILAKAGEGLESPYPSPLPPKQSLRRYKRPLRWSLCLSGYSQFH